MRAPSEISGSDSRTLTQQETILRVGLVGCGKMGLHHLAAIAKAPDARLVGIADPLADAEDLKGLIPADVRIVADVGALVAETRPDVVHIVTPPQTHAAISRALIDAGVHVYVEKPFAMSKAEAEDILARAADRGVRICAGHQNLFERPAILAREHITSAGRVVHIESFFSFRQIRRTITPVDQAKDILPHAVYPLIDQMRAATGLHNAQIAVVGIDVRTSGDVYALLRLGDCTGVLLVTLSGRPIEQYQTIVGTNGVMRADYVTGSLTRLLGPGTGPGILLLPYRRAWQTVKVATRNVAGIVLGRHGSYPGLTVLVKRFYESITSRAAGPMTPQLIVDTVDICEQIGAALDRLEQQTQAAALARLDALASRMPPTTRRGVVLVTGGTGLLGRRVVEELRYAGYPVRTVARRMPPPSARVPGVEYVIGDLARGLSADAFDGVESIVHCAAETAGGKSEQQQNSIAATRLLIEGGAAAGVKVLVHVSSLAVIKPGSGRMVDETTPVDAANLERGPYVWGKAESELLARQLGQDLGLQIKVIRPGPLVDFADFQAPGRLGREVGPWYVAIGGRKSPLSILNVATGARVIRSYIDDIAAAPDVVNLVESPAPTRAELVGRLRSVRPDLSIIWFPALLLRMLSAPAKWAQRWLMGRSRPVDLYAAFSSERYKPDVAASVIARAKQSARPASTLVA
jgi:predicted dehydrogenase/nucleoside-diphosphate-sugar epimerase